MPFDQKTSLVKQKPRAGNADHLQEFVQREQAFGLTALAVRNAMIRTNGYTMLAEEENPENQAERLRKRLKKEKLGF